MTCDDRAGQVLVCCQPPPPSSQTGLSRLPARRQPENISKMFRFVFVTVFALLGLASVAVAAPRVPSKLAPALRPRTVDPQFPNQPPSCPICAQNYDSISSCAQVAPVLANVSMIIFNPGAFINVIQCACTDTFQSVFPQCADCFQKTNQSDVLDAPDLPSVVSGMRNICALASTLFGNVSGVDNETTSTTASPAPTTSANAAAPLLKYIHSTLGVGLLSVFALLVL